MNTVYIGLGSNLGNSRQILLDAWKSLGERPGIRLGRLSSPYRTEPVGMVSSNWFINAAGEVTTNFEPLQLLHILLAVEKEFGRIREPAAKQYRDRSLDLDLLLYGQHILNRKDLVLPHPGLEHRLFVLCPLAEIAPGYIHPLLHRTIRDLLIQMKEDRNHCTVEKVSW